MQRAHAPLRRALRVGAAAWLAAALPADALILQTTNAAQVATFAAGQNLEDFDDLDATALSSYAPGQLVDVTSRFSSRDSTTSPTFHSGGASPNDPVGNPGTPVGIVSPSGAIAADVESGANVAAPLVINTDEPWSNAFMEVIFFPGNVERVGFWITHGSVRLDLRDRQGSNLTTGDVTVTGNEGEFIGIARGESDIAVVALSVSGGGDAFTIDDFVYADSVPEPAGMLGVAAGGLALAGVRRRASPTA
jgi:hypothetical protein